MATYREEGELRAPDTPEGLMEVAVSLGVFGFCCETLYSACMAVEGALRNQPATLLSPAVWLWAWAQLSHEKLPAGYICERFLSATLR